MDALWIFSDKNSTTHRSKIIQKSIKKYIKNHPTIDQTLIKNRSQIHPTSITHRSKIDQNPILELLGSQEPRKECQGQSQIRIRAPQKTPQKRARACIHTRSSGDQNIAPRSIEGQATPIFRRIIVVRGPPGRGI